MILISFHKCSAIFFQSLVDNFEQCFPAADFLQAVDCLNPLMWPQDPLKRALFGKSSVAELSKCFGLTSAEAALTVVDNACSNKVVVLLLASR